MAQLTFLARIAGKTRQILALVTSTGVADANRIVATGSDGKLDASLMPTGIGAATVSAVASEALTAGKLVNFHDASGVFSVRLADNSNGRPAQGYVAAAFSSSATATVYPLDSVNTNVTGLTIGSAYYLGTAGGVISTPLDEVAEAGTAKISQYIGVAKSATELITEDSEPVYL